MTNEQKLLAVICHLAYLFAGLGLIVVPLIIYLWRKDDYFVFYHAKQALVAHLFILAASLIVSFLCMLLIGILLLPVLAILWVILIVTSIIASIKALNGEYYQYPFIQTYVDML